MKVELDLASVKESRWYEYGERFLFGGVITAATGEIARRFGPEAAGLFLAFPAIFPASVTLVASHEREAKEKAGKPGRRSGRATASTEAAGTAIGTLGLIAFALFVRAMLSRHSSGLVLVLATLLWFGVSAALWALRKTALPALRRRRSAARRREEHLA